MILPSPSSSWIPALCLAAALPVSACGGSSGGGVGGSAGGSSSDGASSSSTSTGGPLPIADAAWTLNLLQDNPIECMLASHTSSVGSVTADMRITVVPNGDASASINCTVKGSGSFSVDAQANQDD